MSLLSRSAVLGRRFSSARVPALTKIVATIGPASEEYEPLAKCVAAGMDVMRVNFSHATPEEFFMRTGNLAKAPGGERVALLLDTRGPEIRTGGLLCCKESGNRKAKVLLETGATVELTTVDDGSDGAGSATRMFVNYAPLASKVKAGDAVLLDDGLVTLRVVATDGATTVTCVVENTNEIGERKGVNIPGVDLGLPAMSKKDEADVLFGVQNGIDFVAASFVNDAAGVEQIRAYIAECVATVPAVYPNGEVPLIVAKIESRGALDNLEEIVLAADGVMVARGDLGVEIDLCEVVTWQKTIVEACQTHGKPVIVATQMLDSMATNPRPTRAEVADVTNAVIEGADAVMLSGESANGNYPVESIQTQRAIIDAAERWAKQSEEDEDADDLAFDRPQALAVAALAAQSASRAAVVVVLDMEGGMTTRRVAALRPTVPVFAVTTSPRVARQLALYRAIASQTAPDANEMSHFELGQMARDQGLASDDDVVVVVAHGALTLC